MSFVNFRHFLTRLGNVCVLLLCCVTTVSVAEKIHLDYVGHILRYAHHNTETNRVTGYTEYSYFAFEENNTRYLAEVAENKKEGEEDFNSVFILYHPTALKARKVILTDLRSQTELTAQWEAEDNVISVVLKKDKELRAKQIQSPSGAYFFEELHILVRARLSDMLKKTQTVTVAFPSVLFQSSVPDGFSLIDMEVITGMPQTVSTVHGNQSAVAITFQPASFWLKTLLPASKSTVTYLVGKEPPHYVYESRFGQYRYILEP